MAIKEFQSIEATFVLDIEVRKLTSTVVANRDLISSFMCTLKLHR